MKYLEENGDVYDPPANVGKLIATLSLKLGQ